MKRIIVLIFSLILGFSCAQKQTKVILLPQDDGSIGAVTMTSDQGEAVTLDKPYMVSQSGTMQTTQADRKTIEKTYGNLLKMEFKPPKVVPAEPAKAPPETFILFFESNALELTPESREKLAQIITLLNKKLPTRIRVAGYTDTVGDPAANLTLSSRRADHIARQLNQNDGNTNRTEIRGYGEHGLMLTTPDNTPEPRNRRVKVYIY